jgi:hypothetical protein
MRGLFDLAKTVLWALAVAAVMFLFFASIAPPGTMRLPWH